MSKFLAAAIAAAALTIIDMQTTQANAEPSLEALCWAKASKKRFVPGSAERKAFIKNCIATESLPPSPDAVPPRRKP